RSAGGSCPRVGPAYLRRGRQQPAVAARRLGSRALLQRRQRAVPGRRLAADRSRREGGAFAGERGAPAGVHRRRARCAARVSPRALKKTPRRRSSASWRLWHSCVAGLPAAAGLLFVLLLVLLLVVLLRVIVARLGLVAAGRVVRREDGGGGEESNREDRCQDGLHGIPPFGLSYEALCNPVSAGHQIA